MDDAVVKNKKIKNKYISEKSTSPSYRTRLSQQSQSTWH